MSTILSPGLGSRTKTENVQCYDFRDLGPRKAGQSDPRQEQGLDPHGRDSKHGPWIACVQTLEVNLDTLGDLSRCSPWVRYAGDPAVQRH